MHPIERYRKGKGWTQSDLAKQVGVTINAVQNWEKGAEPRPGRLRLLADTLGVGTPQLLDELYAWNQAHKGGQGGAG